MSTSLSPRSPVAPVHPTRQQLDELDALLQRMLELPVSTAADDSARPAEEAIRPPNPEKGRPEPRVLPMPIRHDAHPPLSANEEEGEAWVPLRSSWQPSAQTWGPLAKQWQEAQQAGQPAPPENTLSRPVPSDDGAADEAAPSSAANILAMPLRRAIPAADEAEAPESRTATVERPGRSALPTSWQVDAHANEQLEPLPSLKALLPPLAAASSSAAQPALAPPAADEPPLTPLLWPLAAVNTIFDCCLLVFGPFGNPLRTRGGKAFLGTVGILCLLGAAALSAIDWFGWTW